jgi:4-amino-4-deoxy-L-arabinose transferase-like glycosyltransferase
MTQIAKNDAFTFSSVFALSEDTLALATIVIWTVIGIYVTVKNPTVWLSDMFGFIPRVQTLSLHSLSGWVDGLYPFGYPLLLKSLFWLTHDYEVAGRIISLASGVVGLYLLYKLGSLTFDRKVGVLAVVFGSVNPTYLKYATVSGTDMVAMVTMLSGLYAVCACALCRSARREMARAERVAVRDRLPFSLYDPGARTVRDHLVAHPTVR